MEKTEQRGKSWWLGIESSYSVPVSLASADPELCSQTQKPWGLRLCPYPPTSPANAKDLSNRDTAEGEGSSTHKGS